ncbi:MAG: T9SS type A sorting domain-containing protein [Taibaiella sp.]|nr:T9SS type A sorting domain-containing protein [Taibaiella sp.]
MKNILLLFSLFFFSPAFAQYAISTVAGTGIGGFSGDGGAATLAQVEYPQGVCLDKDGNVYIADSYGCRIRKIDKVTGIITSVAGNGVGPNAGNNVPATDATLALPISVYIDKEDNLYISCRYCVRKVNLPTGIISTVAGSFSSGGYTGDGGNATASMLATPICVAVAKNGDVFIGDRGNNTIRKIEKASGTISTFAGNGLPSFSGDGGPASSAQLNFAGAIAIDTNDNIYIGDNNRIRKVENSTGIINTIGGTGAAAHAGDGGDVAAASIITPSGMCVDNGGNIYFSETFGSRVRKVDVTSNTIKTIAGNGNDGFSGDGGSGSFAEMNLPIGVCVNGNGSTVYIADKVNHRIRKLYAPSLDMVRPGKEVTVAVFPNPSTGRFRVNLDISADCQATVCNAIGQVVMQTQFSSGDFEINLDDFPMGIYLLSVETAESRAICKLQVSR